MSMLDLIRIWFSALAMNLALTLMPANDTTITARRYIDRACADLMEAIEEEDD